MTESRVTLNDVTVEKIGLIVDETSDVVKVNGSVVSPVTKKVYVVFNKPYRVMTTLFDPFRRRTVRHFMKNLQQHVYPVGRLDYDTEGVLILCNDGDLTYRLAHPRYRVPKVYYAKVNGNLTRADVIRIQRGVKLADGAIGRAQADILGYGKGITRIKLTLTEGRKREIKQLCKAVGHPVKHLRRVEFAGVDARGLKPGAWRYLTPSEINRLKALVRL